ncbi:MAG: hypothetical protein IJ881_10415 [Neisseriaceae bacterium]|nr:hypothetical protein [Neisseriaceae bacterium]
MKFWRLLKHLNKHFKIRKTAPMAVFCFRLPEKINSSTVFCYKIHTDKMMGISIPVILPQLSKFVYSSI